MFVRKEDGSPRGNDKLLHMGAIPLARDAMTSVSIREWIIQHERPAIKSPAIAQAQLSFHDSHVDYEYDNKIDEREGVDLLQVIWPYLERALVEPQSITELAAIFDLREVQLNDWMDRAMNENKVRKLGNGDKYVLTTHADTT